MPDLYMPDVKVEIAFNAGYTTPAASRVWTDVSQYVELAERIEIGVGRTDERSSAGPNSLTLTLDNSDGRFTAGRSGSPYFPNVKVGRPIRVTATPVGGTASTRFVGFVDEWPVEWEGSDAYAKAKVRATSRLSRLGLTASLRSMPEASIAAAQPAFYWTLGDPQGSTTAMEAFGATPLFVTGGTVTFGSAIGPQTDGLTAVDTTGNGVLQAGLGMPSGPKSLRVWVRLLALPVSQRVIAGGGPLSILVTSTGTVATASGLTGPNINDGAGHDIVQTLDGATERLYVDGVLVASSPGFSFGSITNVTAGTFDLSVVLAHLAFFNSALTASQVSDQSSSMSGLPERTDQRVTRLLGWVGVASSEVTVQTGAETMTYQKTDGQSVVDGLRECESTEGGVLFDGRDGNVTFHNRSNRYLKTATATLNMAAQHVERDYSPKLDRSTLTNDVTVSNPTTEQTARSTSAASQTEYGIATSSATSVASTYEAMQQKAAWTVASYAEPRSRVPSLTVDVLAHQGLTPSTQTLLGVNVGDLLAVTNAPTQAATTSPSYFVEGYGERIGPQSYEITYNLSPTYPALSTFVLDDTTRGVLDSSYVLAL